jgi:hypothetical protein
MVLQMLLEPMDFLGDTPLPGPEAEGAMVDILYVGMGEMGLRQLVTPVGGPIEFTGEIEALEAFPLKYRRPFGGFKGDAVCAGEPGRDKSDVVNCSAGSATGHTTPVSIVFTVISHGNQTNK